MKAMQSNITDFSVADASASTPAESIAASRTCVCHSCRARHVARQRVPVTNAAPSFDIDGATTLPSLDDDSCSCIARALDGRSLVALLLTCRGWGHRPALLAVLRAKEQASAADERHEVLVARLDGGRLGIGIDLWAGEVCVGAVTPDGPGDLVGLRVGDVVEQIEGVPCSSIERATALVNEAPPEVRMSILRRPVIAVLVVAVRMMDMRPLHARPEGDESDGGCRGLDVTPWAPCTLRLLSNHVLRFRRGAARDALLGGCQLGGARRSDDELVLRTDLLGLSRAGGGGDELVMRTREVCRPRIVAIAG